MTTQATIDAFDLDTLMDIIKWAELSVQTTSDVIPGYESWGRWDQGQWAADWKKGDLLDHIQNRNVCGTAFCIAGQVAWQNEYRMLLDPADLTANSCIKERPTNKRDNHGHVIWEDVPGAQPVDIEHIAADLLGITAREANRVFDGNNTITNLKERVNWLCRTRHLPLAYPDFAVYEEEALPF